MSLPSLSRAAGRWSCRAALTMCCLAGAPARARAQVTAAGPDVFSGMARLTFEDAPNGAPLNTRYAGRGVTFTRDDGGVVTALDWAALGRGTTSPGQVLTTSGIPYTSHVNLLFDAPQTGVGAYFGNDQLNPFSPRDPTPGFRFMTLSVFGAGGLIGSVRVAPNNNVAVDQFIGLVSVMPFTRARFELDPAGAPFSIVLDDLVFGAAAVSTVPEPATLTLAAAGLLTLARAARRRRPRA